MAGIGALGMRVSGFKFAKEAGSLFLAKLPVLFLVALLIERTDEVRRAPFYRQRSPATSVAADHNRKEY